MQTTKKCYRVEKDQIGFIKFIFEAYEGIAVISTLSDYAHTIVITIAPGCEDEVEKVLNDLKKDIRIEPADIDPSVVRSIY